MEKDKIRVFVKEKKPLLLSIIGAALVLIVVLCIFFAIRGRNNSVENVDNGIWITAEELESSGLKILPEESEQVQIIADTASELLSELSAAGSGRESMIQSLRDAILGMNYGLTEEEAQELSQWLVDWYLEKYETHQSNSQIAEGDNASALGQIQADLQEMADYLEQLDASVTYNKEELQNLTTVQGDSLNTIQEYLYNLKQEISVLQEEFSSYESMDTSHLEESVNTGITNISSLLGTLYESIANSQNEILVELTESSLGSDEKFEAVNDRLGDLTVSINQNLKEIDSHLNRVMDTLMADNDEQNREFIQKLQSTQEQVTTLINEFAQENALQLTRMEENSAARYESLTQTLTEVNDAITDTLEEMRVENSEQNTALVEQLQTMKAELDTALGQISENNEAYYTSLTETLADMYAGLDSTLEFMQNISSEEHVSLLSSLMQELDSVQAELSAILSGMESDNAERYEAVAQSISSLTSDLQAVNTGLMEKLAEIQADSDSDTQEILSALQTGTESISTALSNMEAAEIQRDEAMSGQLDSLSAQLQATGENLNSVLEQMQAENAGQNAALQELIQETADGIHTTLEALEQSGEEWYADTNSNINTKVTELMNNLDGIHNNITSTQLDIRQALVDMQMADAQRMNQIMEEFYGITADLAAINTSMDTAHGEIKTLITEVETNLQNEADANQSELLGALTEMDSSFEQANSEGFQNLLNSLQAQAENMQSQFDALNNSMTANTSAINQTAETNKTEVLNKLASMESNISNTVNNIGTGTSVSQEAILERIGQLEENTNNRLSGLSGDIQSVFQRVSNRKALLASALLTKNVVIDEDATFQEIYDAILSIKQETVIGVDKIPGTIEYEYHYHTGDAQNGGGCYTVEDVHHHNAGCYQLCTYSWTGCEGSTGWTDGNSISHCPYRETHSICNGGQTMYKTYDHYNGGGSQSGHRSGGSSTHAISVCGKTEGQHYGWTTGCGLQNGQIIGAHIVYDADAVSAAAATYRMKAANENSLAMEKLEELMNALEQANEAAGVNIPEDNSGLTDETEKETETVAEETESETSTEEETESDTVQDTEVETGTQGKNESGTVEETESESDTVEETESESEKVGETESETEAEMAEERPEESEMIKEDSETVIAEESSSVQQEESSIGKEPDQSQTAEEPNNQNEAETFQEAKPQDIQQDETAAFSARREYKTVKEGAGQKEKVLTAAA